MKQKKLRYDLEYFLYLSFRRWLESMSLDRAVRIHRPLARFWMNGLKIRRQVAEENIRAAFPLWKPARVQAVLRRCFLHFSRVMVEQVLLSKILSSGLRHFVVCRDWSALDDALQEKKGVILVGGHLGNWELLGCAIAASGYPLWAVAFQQKNKRVGELFNQHHRLSGIRIILKQHARQKIPEVLRRGNIIGLIADQDAGTKGVFVPFLGRPASTPAGPAVYSLRYRTPLVYAACIYSNGRYELHFDRIPTGNLRRFSRENLVEITKRFTQRLEEDVRRFPEQWFWMHRRWKTQPVARSGWHRY